MSAKRALVALTCLVVASLLGLGVVSGLFGPAAQDLYATGLLGNGGSATLPSAAVDTPAAAPPRRVDPTRASDAPAPAGTPSPTAGLPADVLEPAEPRPVRRDLVRARIRAVSDGSAAGRLSAAALDVRTGKTVYADGAGTPLIPASTTKLLTSAAALSLLGPEHRFTTTVVQPSARRLVLVGGGDPYLAKGSSAARYPARASVEDLASATARRLERSGHTSVRLSYDASLFRGPAWNPRWPTGYADQVTATSALWVDEGRVNGSPGPRVSDPARSAAAAFAAALRRRDITVTGIDAGRAPAGADRIAQVASMPLEEIVEQLLRTSDNDAAEVLLRQAGLAGKGEGSITAGRRAVRARLDRLGVWSDSAAIADGSGLARETTIPAQLLVELLRLGTEDDYPELRALITGLPVAGVEGSLRSRFSSEEARPARGLVRGKTGTLRRVHSLAGFVRTADGSMFVYAFVVNDPENDYAAKVWLDKVSAALGTCGCR